MTILIKQIMLVIALASVAMAAPTGHGPLCTSLGKEKAAHAMSAFWPAGTPIDNTDPQQGLVTYCGGGLLAPSAEAQRSCILSVSRIDFMILLP